MIYILIGILLLLLITSKNNVEAFEGQVVEVASVEKHLGKAGGE